MPETFDLAPFFGYETTHKAATISTDFESGDIQTRSRWTRTRRQFKYPYDAATEAERAEIVQFWQRQKGDAGTFNVVTLDPVGAPADDMVLATVASGAQTQRTYYVEHTWVTANGETTVGEQQSILVPVNQVLKVTVPEFPPNVTKARMYVGTGAANGTRQAEIATSGGSWQEPDTGLVAGAAKPAGNTATETILVHFLGDELRVNRLSANTWSIGFELEERFA